MTEVLVKLSVTDDVGLRRYFHMAKKLFNRMLLMSYLCKELGAVLEKYNSTKLHHVLKDRLYASLVNNAEYIMHVFKLNRSYVYLTGKPIIKAFEIYEAPIFLTQDIHSPGTLWLYSTQIKYEFPDNMINHDAMHMLVRDRYDNYYIRFACKLIRPMQQNITLIFTDTTVNDTKLAGKIRQFINAYDEFSSFDALMNIRLYICSLRQYHITMKYNADQGGIFFGIYLMFKHLADTSTHTSVPNYGQICRDSSREISRVMSISNVTRRLYSYTKFCKIPEYLHKTESKVAIIHNHDIVDDCFNQIKLIHDKVIKCQRLDGMVYFEHTQGMLYNIAETLMNYSQAKYEAKDMNKNIYRAIVMLEITQDQQVFINDKPISLQWLGEALPSRKYQLPIVKYPDGIIYMHHWKYQLSQQRPAQQTRQQYLEHFDDLIRDYNQSSSDHTRTHAMMLIHIKVKELCTTYTPTNIRDVPESVEDVILWLTHRYQKAYKPKYKLPRR